MTAAQTSETSATDFLPGEGDITLVLQEAFTALRMQSLYRFADIPTIGRRSFE
jgi:hypothetical protein